MNWCRRALLMALVTLSVLVPWLFIDIQSSSTSSYDSDHGIGASLYRFSGEEVRRRSALEQLEVLVPKEVGGHL
jgi:hypothetical protein